MIRKLRSIWNAALRFKRSEDGNSTIEFVMMVPVAIMIAFTSYETGMLATRQVMLERGLDVVVRDLRIGRLLQPDHDMLKRAICEESLIIPDCINQIRLEMIANDVRNWQPIAAQAQCVDRAEPVEPTITIPLGGNNQLMVLRVCALFDPVMPTSTIGQAIPKTSGDAYALVASTSFVMEPFQ